MSLEKNGERGEVGELNQLDGLKEQTDKNRKWTSEFNTYTNTQMTYRILGHPEGCKSRGIRILDFITDRSIIQEFFYKRLTT